MTQFRASAAAKPDRLVPDAAARTPGGARPDHRRGPLVVAPRSQAILADLPGRISPVRVCAPGWRASSRSATSRKARPSEGDLCTIEPAPRSRGAGRLARPRVRQAQALADRYQPLVKIAAVSRQEYDDAVAALQTAKANQVSAQADVKTAQLDLGYASVRAPISGRIGRGLVTEGSLARANPRPWR